MEEAVKAQSKISGLGRITAVTLPAPIVPSPSLIIAREG